jgi:hypothetical protein
MAGRSAIGPYQSIATGFAPDFDLPLDASPDIRVDCRRLVFKPKNFMISLE